MITGTVIGDRYRIEERIGGGGMALVYRATDTLLGRPVAVKVLRDGYTDDADFVRRFRREAQAAASLGHRHVVSIYDVGHEGNVHYIVMELVEGPDLKEYIQQQGALPCDRAAQLALEILDALGHAHARGLVHRDIKPSNILLTGDGHVKVSDFGIARHTTTDTLTNTNSIFGSAHYFSPEQARGLPAGQRSDLYSLGVVLYEMVTGEVPFKGESPISVALKHVQDEPPLPSQINAKVPLELEQIITRALAKDPEERYHTAEQMRQDLIEFQHDFRAGRTHVAASDFPTQRLNLDRDRKRVNGLGKTKNRGRQSGYGRWVTLLLVLVLLAAGMSYAISYALDYLYVPETEVPNLEGLEYFRAEELLRQRGLGIRNVGAEFSAEVPVGHIIRQDRPTDMPVRVGTTVEVYVSRGPRQIEVPTLVNLGRVEAELELQRLGLEVGEVDLQYATDQARDRVMAQQPPPGTPVEEGTLVDLVVSRGPRTMPTLYGKRVEEIEEILTELELELGDVNDIHDSAPRGTIISHTPAPHAALRPGQRVDLVLSKGPAPPAKETLLQISVPPGRGNVTVQLVLLDGHERSVIHETVHPAGRTFPLLVKYHSDQAVVQMYVDGQLHDEIVLP